MKWVAVAAVILGVMLYVASPYYTLIELAQASRSGNAAEINQLVDWKSVRTSVKAQLQAHLEHMPKTAEQKNNPAMAALGNAVGVTLANALIDKLLTPEGITNMILGARAATSPATTTQTAKGVPTPTGPASRQQSLYDLIKFAFFVSPVDFRLDLRPVTDRTSPDETTVTLMLMFKGTGWQVTDVRLRAYDLASKMASARN